MAHLTRPCVEVAVPPGPSGLEVLLPALSRALDGSGPAIALVPAGAAGRYQEQIRSAVRPGEPVPSGVAVVVSTSGSSGDPTGVLLPGAALLAAAAGFTARVAVPRHRWVAALPLHHTGGLMVAVRAVATGTEPAPLASLGGAERFTVAEFEAGTAAARAGAVGDRLPLAVSLVPAMLAALEREPGRGIEALTSYDVVLVGGAATPPDLLARLAAAGVRLRRSYGMTETCGGAVLDGLPLAGISVSVATGGRLRLAGPQVASGYRGGRLPGRWGTGADGARWFLTDDVGSVSAAGVVTVLGRADDVVQVGGVSVSTGSVADVLGEDHRVAAAEVVALPDERFGATLVALVVPTSGAGAGGPGAGPAGSGRTPLSEDLADRAADRLGRAGRPRHVRLIEAIPTLESGKPDRRALARLAADALQVGPGPRR